MKQKSTLLGIYITDTLDIPNALQRFKYMKCRRLEALTFQISNKGRLSGITAKTALTHLYFIYCVSHRFYYEMARIKT